MLRKYIYIIAKKNCFKTRLLVKISDIIQLLQCIKSIFVFLNSYVAMSVVFSAVVEHKIFIREYMSFYGFIFVQTFFISFLDHIINYTNTEILSTLKHYFKLGFKVTEAVRRIFDVEG